MVAQSLPALPANAITIIDDRPMTTSRKVAETFGKPHKNVLRDIRELDVPEEWGGLNFEPTSYFDTQGKTQPARIMTRDGFVLLVMGFTGKQAMQFKVAYIEAFNAMAAEIDRQEDTTGDSITDDLVDMVRNLSILDRARLLVALNEERFGAMVATVASQAAMASASKRQSAIANSTAIPHDRRMTTAEAAAAAGVSYQTITRWAERGRLHPERTANGRVFWDLQEVSQIAAG